MCEHLSSSQIQDTQGLEGREPLQNTHFNLELRAHSRVPFGKLKLVRTLRCRTKTAHFLAAPFGIHQNEDRKRKRRVERGLDAFTRLAPVRALPSNGKKETEVHENPVKFALWHVHTTLTASSRERVRHSVSGQCARASSD